jgi:hypothetical protein
MDMVAVRGRCLGRSPTGAVELQDCRLVSHKTEAEVRWENRELFRRLERLQEGSRKLQGSRPVLEKNDQLTYTDPFDKVRKRSKAKTYTVRLTAGKTYQIDMTSSFIDSYLRLENPAGPEVAEDDDSGGNLNARIIYACTQTGAYRIIATTFAAGGTGAPTGPFTLKVQER